MHKLFCPLILALAFAPALSEAASYSGKSLTTSPGHVRGFFQLKVSGRKISGLVATPAVQHELRVRGTVDKAGRVEIQSRNKLVKGKLTGTLREGKILVAGRFFTRGQGSARVALRGDVDPASSGVGADGYSMLGQTVVLPSPSKEEWDKNYYSYVLVHFTAVIPYYPGRPPRPPRYQFDLYFAGKSGMKSASDINWATLEDVLQSYGSFDTGEDDYFSYHLNGISTSLGFQITVDIQPKRTNLHLRSGHYVGFAQ